jgi:hypothetical protein
MQTYEMRNYIKSAYNYSSKWCNKVDRMPDNQVVAVYYSIVNQQSKKKKQAEIDRKFHQVTVEEYSKTIKEEKPKEPEFHQVTMFEYLKDINSSK